MELSCSPLHLLAEIACYARQKAICVQDPFDGKSIASELSVVHGAALGLVMLSSWNEFTNPGGFVSRKEEKLINSVDFEASDSNRSRKRKLVYDFQAENPKTKKQRKSLNQSVLISTPSLTPPFKTKISVSGLKSKFHRVPQSCLNSSSALGGVLMDSLKTQFSWKGKRKRQLKRRFSKQQTTSEAVLRSSDEGAGTNPSTQHKKDEVQTELTIKMKTKIQEKIQELGGSEAKLVIQKQLHESDVNSNNSRLSIPAKQIQNEFLEENENCLLDKRAENGQKLSGLEVLVLDPRFRQFNLKLKKWRMNKNIIYNLTHEWNNVRISNGLEEKDLVQLWSFRRHDQLCFALVKL